MLNRLKTMVFNRSSIIYTMLIIVKKITWAGLLMTTIGYADPCQAPIFDTWVRPLVTGMVRTYALQGTADLYSEQGLNLQIKIGSVLLANNKTLAVLLYTLGINGAQWLAYNGIHHDLQVQCIMCKVHDRDKYEWKNIQTLFFPSVLKDCMRAYLVAVIMENVYIRWPYLDFRNHHDSLIKKAALYIATAIGARSIEICIEQMSNKLFYKKK